MEIAVRRRTQSHRKELVLKNFAGASSEQLLERMVELSLYAEDKLKAG